MKEWHSKYNHIYFTQAPKLEKKAQIQILKNPDAVSQFILNNTSMVNIADDSRRESMIKHSKSRLGPIDFNLRTENEEGIQFEQII